LIIYQVVDARYYGRIPFEVGFDKGKIAGLGHPDSFIASRTCKHDKKGS